MTSTDLDGALRAALSAPMTAPQRVSLDDRVRERLERRARPTLHSRPRTIAQGLPHAILGGPTAWPAWRRRPARRLLLASVPVLAVAVAGILLATSLLKPPSAFATWTPVPGPVDPAFAAAMHENCALRPIPTDDPNISAERMREMLAQQAILAKLPLVVMDQRGRAAVALFADRLADGQASVLCMTVAKEEGGIPVAGGGGASTGAVEAPADGPLRLFTAQRTSSDAGMYTAYAGWVAPGVARVAVDRSNGQIVTASVASGYFVAWWPGASAATKFTGYNADGTVITEIGNNGWDFR